MCPKTDEELGRKSMVGQPELVLSYPLPSLHYHFLLNFHLHCHCIPWLSYESHIASSIWFLNDPWLGFTLAGIYRLLPLLAPDWLTLTRCILRHWNRTDEYCATRSGLTTTHPKLPCAYIAFTHNTHFLKKSCWLRNVFSILCHLTFIEWFCFEKDDKAPVRVHMSPVSTRVPMNRWDSLHVSKHQYKAPESL